MSDLTLKKAVLMVRQRCSTADNATKAAGAAVCASSLSKMTCEDRREIGGREEGWTSARLQMQSLR